MVEIYPFLKQSGRGAKRIALKVEADNVAACALYKKLKFIENPAFKEVWCYLALD